MTKPATIFDPDDDVEERALQEADVAAGRVVPHTEVEKWLESWGTSNELSRPRSAARS